MICGARIGDGAGLARRVKYDRHIIDVLASVGDNGISVKNLALHVYNMNCNMFDMPDFDDVQNCVRRFIMRYSKPPHPLVTRTNRRGCYRIDVEAYSRMTHLPLFVNAGGDGNCTDECPKEDKSVDSLLPSLFD